MLVETRVGHGGRRGAGVGQWQGGRGALLHWVLVRVKMAAQGSNLVAQYPKIGKYFTLQIILSAHQKIFQFLPVEKYFWTEPVILG